MPSEQVHTTILLHFEVSYYRASDKFLKTNNDNKIEGLTYIRPVYISASCPVTKGRPTSEGLRRSAGLEPNPF